MHDERCERPWQGQTAAASLQSEQLTDSVDHGDYAAYISRVICMCVLSDAVG